MSRTRLPIDLEPSSRSASDILADVDGQIRAVSELPLPRVLRDARIRSMTRQRIDIKRMIRCYEDIRSIHLSVPLEGRDPLSTAATRIRIEQRKFSGLWEFYSFEYGPSPVLRDVLGARISPIGVLVDLSIIDEKYRPPASPTIIVSD